MPKKFENAKLILPEEKYLKSYLEACVEFRESGILNYSFHDPAEYESWKHTIFQKMQDDRNGINLLPGYVPSTAFWLVEGGEFIGMGSVRHYLTDILARYGGNIGYIIRPSKHNMGYGTHQLKLLLLEARKLGIRQPLITCDENNTASYRVMEKNGGVYFDTIDNMIRKNPVRTRRYLFDASGEDRAFITTQRLFLRPFSQNDIDAVYEYSSDSETVKYMLWGPNSKKDAARFISDRIEKSRETPRKNYTYAVCLKDGTLIGAVEITESGISEGHVGWIINKNHWGRGYGTEAAKAVTAFGFERLCLRRIVAVCDADNVASYRVMEKCGMTREAFFRKNRLAKGYWKDECLYAVIRDKIGSNI